MILQALAGLDRRQNATPGETPVADGYSKERIGFVLVIDPDGRLVGNPLDLRTTEGKRIEARAMDVPQPVKRTSGIAANFLWDKSAYVLGLEKVDPKWSEKDNAKRADRLPKEHVAFVALHCERLGGTNDVGLRALLLFLESWDPAAPDPRIIGQPDLLSANIVFRLDGERSYLHERPAAKALAQQRPLQVTAGTCLVTGKADGAARLHPAIKGVWGAQSSGASIVSFNLDAFGSYGKEQGENAPVSDAAAAAYGRALNGLLDRNSRRRVQIGDTSTVFWAERDAPDEEAAIGFWLAGAVGEQTETEVDRNETAKLLGIMEQLSVGRPVEEHGRQLDPKVRFYILGLSPNAARLSVRFWHVDTLEGLAGRFLEHLRDLAIEPTPWKRPPALWRLLIELAVERKSENVPKQIAGELTRAILTGGRYPRSLLSTVIMRIRADGDLNGHRAAICKACLVRGARIDGAREDDYVALDVDNKDPAYRMGRLFAVLEAAQRAALGENINATIRDKFYAAASATPAAVFPLLIRGSNNHLGTIRKDADKGGQGRARALEARIGEIVGDLPDRFPKSFSLEDQGRFAIGYYHQRFFRRPKTEAADESGEN